MMTALNVEGIGLYIQNMKDNETNPKFIKQAGRYASLSGSAAGLAVKLAGEKFLGVKIDRDMHSEQLKVILGKLS